MQILITNSVPLNGGDETLLRATYLSFKKEFPNCKIVVLCSRLKQCKQFINDIELDSDLEFISYPKFELTYRVKQKIRRVLFKVFDIDFNSKASLFFATKDERRVKALYRTSDLIISSPGGFLHDFYEIANRINGFKLALTYNKPVVLFAQSIGPFWKGESITLVKQEFSKYAAVILREEKSLAHLQGIDIEIANLHVTSDAAFLIYKLMPELYVKKEGPIKRIAMCFRNWPLDSNNVNDIISKATELCRHLLKDESKEIVFLSTCQGIPEYTDDSILAIQIVEQLPENLKQRCSVDRKKYGTFDLIKQYSTFDVFIGMRLHGAIMSMLGGTPAMGIGYEDKTAGIYQLLKLQNYQVSFEQPLENWIACADKFMTDNSKISEHLEASIHFASNIAYKSIEITKEILSSNESKRTETLGKRN